MDRSVFVGINAYPYPNALRGCLNDITDVQAAIVSVCHFDPAAIVVLKDDQATAAQIKSALQKVVALLKPGDRFLFWYSGHGAQLVDGDAATDVICPVDFDFTLAKSVSVSDFHGIFSRIPSGVTAVWGSDSCHSGDLEKDFYRHGFPKMFRGPASRAIVTPKTPRTFRDVTTALPNIALISGCRSDQTSADAFIEGRYNGALTYYLLKTLKAGDGATVPLTALVPRTQAALSSAGYEQVPQLSGPKSETSRTFLQGQTIVASTVGSVFKLQDGWPVLPASFTGGFDAALNGGAQFAGKCYFFKGDSYVRYDWAKDCVDDGYPKSIKDEWNGLPQGFTSDLDAAVNGEGRFAGKCYIFKGDSYIRYDWETDRMDPGYPKKIASGWIDLPVGFSSGVDAIINGRGPRSGKCFLFKGTECVRYDWAGDRADPGYPKAIADEWHCLPDGFTGALDAAIEGDGPRTAKAYFFKKDAYMRYNWAGDCADV